MARVKPAVHSKKKHRAVLARACGYYGNKSRSYRAANEQVMHSLQYVRDRRAQGRVPPVVDPTHQRRLPSERHVVLQFIAGLKIAGVEVDRKVLADLAVRTPRPSAPW